MNMLTGVSNDYPRARNTDPKTSHEAAEFIRGTAKKQQSKAAEAVRTYPGQTSQELADLTGLDRYMLARRLPEVEGSLVSKGDTRRCQVSGRTATTWWPRWTE